MIDLQQEIYNIMDDLHVIDMAIDELSESKAGIDQSIEDGKDMFDEPDKDWLRRVSYARRMTDVELATKNKNRTFKLNLLSAKRAELKAVNHAASQSENALFATKKATAHAIAQSDDYARFKALVRGYMGDEEYLKMARSFSEI
jgi:hypothetical protein